MQYKQYNWAALMKAMDFLKKLTDKKDLKMSEKHSTDLQDCEYNVIYLD